MYDLGIVPFNTNFEKNITLFNFYDLETETAKQQQLYALIKQSQYVVLPSQRILQTRLSEKARFPKGHLFYQRLLHSTDYKLVYKTPCSQLCKILYLGDTMFTYEQGLAGQLAQAVVIAAIHIQHGQPVFQQLDSIFAALKAIIFLLFSLLFKNIGPSKGSFLSTVYCSFKFIFKSLK